jgi:hypothetical protein
VKGIVGRPTAGVRLSVERAPDAPLDAAPGALTYRGFLHMPESDVLAEATVALPGGAVTVALGEGGTPELSKWAAALVRAATKAPLAGGRVPPRKIVRWRPA